MLRKSALHVLLSLLLLVAQQLSLGHVYTHWNDAGERIAAAAAGDVDEDGKPAKPALHDLCGQCAASAMVAFALPSMARRFASPELAYGAPGIAAATGICRLTACAFPPRGPPQAG
jgi:hypothetical protein